MQYRVRGGGAALLVASLAAVAWGWFAVERTGWSLNETMVPLVMLVAGSMTAAFAALLGVLTLLRPKPAG